MTNNELENRQYEKTRRDICERLRGVRKSYKLCQMLSAGQKDFSLLLALDVDGY